MIFIFILKMVYCVYSLESPRWGDSNENTQHTFILEKIEKIAILSLLTWRCNQPSLARTTPVSNIFSWSRRCSSHWSSTVHVSIVRIFKLCDLLKLIFYLFLPYLSPRLGGILWYRQAQSYVYSCPSTISKDFASDTSGPIVAKFHRQLSGPLGKKNCTNGLGHMTNMATMPIYGKNLKNLLLQNQQTDGLETWYVALGTQEELRLFKLWPLVDHDQLYAQIVGY